MGRTGQHAVVIGASIAGLCAARVLADFYDTVSVFDRDNLPDGPGNRSAIPQDRHVHLLMARGALEFDSLFPGLLDDMVAAGVLMLENRPDAIHFGAAGHVLGVGHRLREEFTAYVPSRPHLEWQLRRRVSAMDTVDIAAGVAAVPRFDRDRQRVTGVLLDDTDASVVEADLVVDASGRAAHLPARLDEWGFDRPREDTVDVGIGYATHKVRMSDATIEEAIPAVVVAGASRRQPLGLGMLRYEDGTWGVTTFGVAKVQPPQDFSGMCALADAVLPPHISSALRSAEPIDPVAFHRYPTSRWRRYDEMTRFPTGIIPFGDAVVSFNPTFGQGMTMTSIQAANLRAVLESGDPDIAGQLARATAKTTYPVWTMNAVGDLTLHEATGPQPWWYRPVGALFDQFLGAAETEPVLAEWFLRRFSLLDSLYMAPSPKIFGRAVRHNMTLWWAGRRRAQDGSERSRSGSR